MNRSWFLATSAAGIAAMAATATGCGNKAPAAAPQAASKSTEQIMQENPAVKQSVVARLEAQIQQSNLSPEEKQRQIAKLRAEGPPP